MIGQKLGGYEIKSQIGEGGMAITYRAYQASMERDVTIKVIHPDLISDSAFIARFEREVKIIARLEHPRILPVYDYGRQGDVVFLVMRYIEGGTLTTLARSRSLALAEINRLIGQVAAALDHAHDKNVVHLDLKPSNILLDLNGEAYLSDFGIARRLEDQPSSASSKKERVFGTPHYMSPEQCTGRDLDSRADVYSLGVMLYELLVGVLPFEGDTREVMRKQVNDSITLPDDLPPQLRAVLSKALAKKRDDRFDSAGALAEAVTAATLNVVIPAGTSRTSSAVTHLTAPRTLASSPVEKKDEPPKPRLDASWRCRNCGASYAGLTMDDRCPSCGSHKPLQVPKL